MAPLPNVHMNLVCPAEEVWLEKSLVGQVWGPNTIAPEALGGRVCSSTRRAAPMLESLVRVLHFHTMHCVTGQVGSVTSPPRQALTDMFPIVAAALLTHLERKRAYERMYDGRR